MKKHFFYFCGGAPILLKCCMATHHLHVCTYHDAHEYNRPPRPQPWIGENRERRTRKCLSRYICEKGWPASGLRSYIEEAKSEPIPLLQPAIWVETSGGPPLENVCAWLSNSILGKARMWMYNETWCMGASNPFYYIGLPIFWFTYLDPYQNCEKVFEE